MYFEASSPARKGDSACFKSQKLPATACQRLTFWYHMYGSGMGTLNVWLESDDGANRQRLWSKTGQQGNRWQQASVDISTVSEYEVWMQCIIMCLVNVSQWFLCPAPPQASYRQKPSKDEKFGTSV